MTANRTTMVIAHRLSTVIDSDLILVLKDGRVFEQGDHTSLISNPNSLYSSLWEKQNASRADNAAMEQNSKVL